jgi:hypothetical protein
VAARRARNCAFNAHHTYVFAPTKSLERASFARAGNRLFVAELCADIFAHDTSQTDCSSTRRPRFVIGYAARFTNRSKKIHRNYSVWNFILRSKVFHMLHIRSERNLKRVMVIRIL